MVEVAADRERVYVLDASALLAMLREEPGGEIVEAVIENSLLCAVNWSEVVQKAIAYDLDAEAIRADLEALGLQIVPFTAEDAETAAELWRVTHTHGLSLGDRACLALAGRQKLPALTADRAWGGLPIDLSIECLR